MGTRWTRRGALALGGGLAVAGIGVGAAGRGPAAAPPPSPPFPSADAARRAGWTVVTDLGAIGDGVSRPLSSLYPTLDAARREHPAAVGLDDELDGAAIQSAVDSGADRVYYPPGRFVHNAAIRVRSGQRHLGAGPGTVLVNNRVRARPVDLPDAHTFEIGNIHPVAMLAGSAQSWATRPLAPVAAGSRTVSLAAPLGGARVAVGDIVMIRSDGVPTAAGRFGVTYDFEMWNRVTAVDPATGRIDLELPVPRDIVAAPAPAEVLAGPTLCLNDGVDLTTGRPWSIVQDVEIGHLAVESAGLCLRTGVWRGWFHDLLVTGENMIGFNALVQSTVEAVDGTFTSRMIEIKHASHDSTLRRIRGVYRAAPGAPPAPAISIGEQSFGCAFEDIACRIGPECRETVRAVELSSPDLRFRGTVQHFGQGGNSQVWAVKSNDLPANPPARISLELTVRSRGGLRSYGVIGGEVARPSDPRDVTLSLDQQSRGAPPVAGVEVLHGSAIRVVRDVGDRPCAVAAPGAELPQGTASC
ncbi:hypothetical protein [Actinomycetospora aeridis]|uniref:Pectate lyase superfamily protein domain-containing protein n=1 Tax=Actinomycetospora aeridis TaxID=3129231 RepID=A0ABU8N7N2_9PSEU